MKRFFKLAGFIGAAAILCTTFTACGNETKVVKNNTQKSEVVHKNNDTTAANTQTNQDAKVEVISGPDFAKQELQAGAKPDFATPLKNSPNSKISVCLEGKGSEAREEGIAKIFIKDSAGNAWQLSLSDAKKQTTPMYVDFIDDDNLIVVIGNAYGTVSLGGNLYMVNVNTGKSALLIDTKNNKVQVTKASKVSGGIKYTEAVYDDNMINHQDAEKTLDLTDSTLSGTIEQISK
jgi:hypothetical protein